MSSVLTSRLSVSNNVVAQLLLSKETHAKNEHLECLIRFVICAMVL